MQKVVSLLIGAVLDWIAGFIGKLIAKFRREQQIKREEQIKAEEDTRAAQEIANNPDSPEAQDPKKVSDAIRDSVRHF